jgi:hypothetical protein
MARGVVVAWAILLLAACGASSPVAGPMSSVVGRVLSAPSCPVQRQGVPCPPRPVRGAAVAVLRGGGVIASTRTSASGRFSLRVVAGRYQVRATNVGPLATTASKVVTVRAGQTVSVRLIVDSGIR